MDAPRVIFRQYDIRGIVGEQVTPQLAHAIGRAFAILAAERVGHAPRLAVGRDNRPSGDLLARAVRDGIAQAGGTAVDIGVLPTPALYLATHTITPDGGLQVTGSHNPSEFNGFKMVAGGGAVYGEDIQRLFEIITGVQGAGSKGQGAGDEAQGAKDKAQGARRKGQGAGDKEQGAGQLDVDTSMLDRYAEAIIARNGPLVRPVKVVVDCGNGVASVCAERILTGLGADVVPLFCESDGTFPNHHPDPTVPENLVDLQAAVRRERAELGIAFDGDGDRIGAVDETGRIVFGDQLLVLLGRDLVQRMGKGHHVIFDVKCSNVLKEQLALAGLKPEIWKTGHSLIKARMKELHAPLAGEMSGHMFFAGDYYGFDDALFAAARLLAYVAREGGPLGRLLADLPKTFATPELRVDCPDEKKFAVIEAAVAYFGARYETFTLDGVRISFADGWGLIRASNTQPVLVMRFEATNEAALAQYRAEVEGWLSAHL